MMNYGTMPYFVPYYEHVIVITTFVTDVGIMFEPETIGPQINLAPNHQDFTPPHKKNRRGKLKRSKR
jgi:hypothetical protein